MSVSSGNRGVTVVICTYSLDLLPDTIASVRSVLAQGYQDKEILVVMDTHDLLWRKLTEALPSSVQIVENCTPGLSEARNSGIEHATGDVIYFLDDDATARPGCLSHLMENYSDPAVIGVGGRVYPASVPAYPEELYWIGGYTYDGFPKSRCQVRNMIGCNMSFRREVFDDVGMFDTSLGRIGRNLITAEETEFCLRVAAHHPEKKIIYEPRAGVDHKVHAYRQKISYGMRRGYYEGLSKARIWRRYHGMPSLTTEGGYLGHLIGRSLPRRLGSVLRGKDISSNLMSLLWIGAVVASVGSGYLAGMVERSDISSDLTA